ncbi:MAG: hypothetical protein ABI988_01550, partial [Nitrospirota bacterium]
AASEEARRYGPHFVGPFALTIGLGVRESLSSASAFRKLSLSLWATPPGKMRVSARRGRASEKGYYSIILPKLSP